MERIDALIGHLADATALAHGIKQEIADPWTAVQPAPQPAPVTLLQGCDVSHWQPPARVKWAEAYDAGIRFAYCKATEGDQADQAFEEHWDQLGRTAVKRGAYHFAYMKGKGKTLASARAQAEAFFDTITGLHDGVGDMPPVLDLEWQRHTGKTREARDKARDADYGPGPKRHKFPIPAVVAWATAFGERCRELFGVLPMLYTGDAFWKFRLGSSNAFKRWHLWQIEYTGDGRRVPESFDEIPAKVSMCPPWAAPTVWQFTGKGRVPFYDGKMDRNLCRSDTFAQLLAA